MSLQLKLELEVNSNDKIVAEYPTLRGILPHGIDVAKVEFLANYRERKVIGHGIAIAT